MPNFLIGETSCDTRSSSDNCLEIPRSGQQGPTIVQQGHGRYYEAASRGRVFSATQSVSAIANIVGSINALCALYNPPRIIDPDSMLRESVSGAQIPNARFVNIISWEMVFDADPSVLAVNSVILLNYLKTGRFNDGAVATVKETIIPSLIGSNIKGVAEFWTKPTFTSLVLSETVCYTLGTMTPSGAVGKIPYMFRFFANLSDYCILLPGTCLIPRLTAASNQGFRTTVVWEEIDL